MKAAGSRLSWGGFGVLLSIVLVGCAADRDLAIMRNDMERMNRQLLQMQVSQEVAQTRPRESEGDRRTIADLKSGLEEVRQQLSVLSERMDASDHQLSRRLNALEARFTPGSSPPPPSPSSRPPTADQNPSSSLPTGQPPGSTPSASSPSSAEAKRLYQAALSDYQRGKFDLAAQGFRSYVEQSPRGDVADTAQYYLGESLYSAKDYRNAIAEFERLARDYPQSPQVPSALLKTGYAYYELKDSVQGRRALRTLIENYPTSKEAKLAEERLRLEDRAGATRAPTGAMPTPR
jgi:tol-pal system protein YbgF